MHTYPLLLTIVICSRISASRRVLTRWPGGYAFLALFLMIAPSAPTVSAAELKVLHVMSYHSPWRWTDRQLEGFQGALKGVDATYRVVQLDTKRNSATDQVERKAREARELIDSWKPDLVYASDDDAQEHVVRHYIGSTRPFVFSGVGNDPAVYGFKGSANVTGVLEHEHFVESVGLVRKLVPKARRIALIFDNAKMWGPVRARIETAMERLPDMKIVAVDVVPTFADYKRKIAEYQKSADMIGTLGIFNLKDAQGKNVPYEDVQRWTVDNSRLPDFAFWIDRVYFGTLCAVTVSEREQGRAAGGLARAILLEGKKPSDLAMEPTRKGVPVISLARARKLGMRIDSSVLLSAEVIQRFEWDQP